jgi:RNA polymerase sigma-70 factor, ECF subfamily
LREVAPAVNIAFQGTTAASRSSSLDRDAAGALIQKHFPGLLCLLRRKLRNDELANDVLGQAVLTALEHLAAGRIKAPELIAGYIFRVALNLARNHGRKFEERRDRRVDPACLDELISSSFAPAEAFESKVAECVRAAIEELSSARDRMIVRRFYLEEEDKEVICRDLGISSLHFDKVNFRARARMKTLLTARGLKPADALPVLLVLLL